MSICVSPPSNDHEVLLKVIDLIHNPFVSYFVISHHYQELIYSTLRLSHYQRVGK